MANRYILEFTVLDPVLVGSGSGENAKNQQKQEDSQAAMEWIPTYVVGQSSLLHQIRKMISLAVDVARSVAPLSATTCALHWKKEMRVSLAPAQGSILEMSYFMVSRDLPELDWSNGHGGDGVNIATAVTTTDTATAAATTKSPTTITPVVESPARLR